MNRRVVVLGMSEATEPIVGALGAAGYGVVGLAPSDDLVGRLRTLGPATVFHAHDDRSGRVQGLLELMGLAYSHSGVLATALAANRHQAKIALRSAGLPVTDHLIVERAEAAQAHQMPPPYVIKPVLAGRSGSRAAPVRLVVSSAREEPPAALLEGNWEGLDPVMVERYLPGRSLLVVVMGGVALGVSERLEGDGEAASADQQIQYVPNGQISPNIYEKLQKMGLKAHEALGCRGVTEISFRFDGRASGESGLVCLGVNTQPGLGADSPVSEQARDAGHSFADLLAWMVEDAGCNR